jgi:hypothetical protein
LDQLSGKVQPMFAQIGWSHNSVTPSAVCEKLAPMVRESGWSHNAKVSSRLGALGSGPLSAQVETYASMTLAEAVVRSGYVLDLLRSPGCSGVDGMKAEQEAAELVAEEAGEF